jgi:lipid-binding SYLF domain-containing protein
MRNRMSKAQASCLCSVLRRVFGLIIALGLFSTLLGNAWAQDPNAKAAALVQSADRSLESFLTDPQWEALRNLLGGARAVYIVPHDVAGGFLITASGGDGVLLRRHGGSWSDPVFMHMGTVGVGFVGGGETQSIVMVVMTEAGVDGLISGVAQLGGVWRFRPG